MEYWHEIVKRFDDPKSIEPNKRDDGTYSQSSVVILLIYLTFGECHPYSIAKHFRKYPLKLKENKNCSTNLTTSKVGTLLNKMKEYGLVTVTENKKRVKSKKTYSINSQILRSPIKDGTCFNRDGSIFEIPIETIEDFLGWLALKQEGTMDKKEEKQLRQGRRHQADRIIQIILNFSESVDYLAFLLFVQAEARDWYSLRELNNKHPTLNTLISHYIHETYKTGGAYPYTNRELLVNLDVVVISQHL
jgi:hypothetical protein